MSSDTTPLLTGQQPSSLPRHNPNLNTNANNQRHWSEETEDILAPDPTANGYQNTGAGYRRRGPPPPGSSILPGGSLDAQRFSGRDRPRGLKRILNCCCLPCRQALRAFQNKYTKTEKYSMAFAGICLLLAVGFLCAYVRARESIPLSGKNGICTSRECTIVAADILRDLKPDVDPCTDFFTFTCGGFLDRETIPDDKAQIGYFNLEVIRSILSPETNNAQRGKDDAAKRNLVKLQSLFESCMDEKKMSEIGVKPLADMVHRMIKVFPAAFSILDREAPASSMSAAMAHLRDVNFRFQSASINRQKLRQQEQEDDDDDAERPAGDRQSKEPEGQAPLYAPVANELPGVLDTPASGEHRNLDKREDDVETESFVPAAAAKPQREELALVIAQLAWVGVTTMVDFDVDADPKNPDDNVLKLGESGLGLPSKEYYQEEKIVNIYQKAVEDMFTIVMGTSNKDGEDAASAMTNTNKPPVVSWAEVAKNVVEFEKLLAAISSEQEDLDNSELTYNPRSLSEITELIPAVDWSLVLEKLLTSGTNVPNPIIVSSPEYLQKLNALLKDTPAMTLQNYFAWRLIKNLSSNLAVELRKPMQQLKAALQGVSADLVTPRWETCIDVVDNSLGAMAGHYFIEKMFQGDSKEMADSIITSLRGSFVKGLNQLEWLDHPTLLNATEKVDLLIQKIGYSVESPDVRSADSLEDYFKDLGIDKADFFGNQIRSKTWQTRQTMGELGKPVDKAKWLMSPQTVNAYYNPSANEIVFPAGILQQPFFHGDNPEYLNYGGIGVVAGHELTHAFDNEGRLYDAHGRLDDWWSNSTLEEFKTRSQCFIDQYGNFTVKDPQGRENHVNGKLTLGENLADNGGLKRSYEAWAARFKSDPHGNKFKNHLLSGLEDYSRDQLYYMAFARVWCSQRRPAKAIESLRTDPHAPAKWRVNGAVQNSPHFAEVFNCKARSSMNPDTKCDMW
ncbi:hypothetical protein BG015_007786 [Linnemannia schmuckeri]|uniref:Endothelin-converting enzyme 1 n=1 Tax=Linnemannia schmuckeri TaxID=64567 RepID=A0A9P5S0P3_9FUNG|nr:hypothetical protein BG015_007786 [Linnemannia schmuckeri]